MIRALFYFLLFLVPIFGSTQKPDIVVLCYHRFGSVAKDSMSVTNTLFESHIKWLKDDGFSIISALDLLDYLKHDKPIPQKSAVITVDDGHISVYTDLAPIVKKYKIPVTLFIYPSAISNAKYAMSWEQIRELLDTKLFDIGSHLLWHPNFKQEKKRLSQSEYEKFVEYQLSKSKEILQKKTNKEIIMLAWAFGIYDDFLEQKALKSGYEIAFSIDRRHVSKDERLSSIPRYLITNNDNETNFKTIIRGKAQTKPGTNINFVY